MSAAWERRYAQNLAVNAPQDGSGQQGTAWRGREVRTQRDIVLLKDIRLEAARPIILRSPAQNTGAIMACVFPITA
jgi:hypothetical protein